MGDLDEGDVPYIGMYCVGCGLYGTDRASCPECGSKWPLFLEKREPYDGGPPVHRTPESTTEYNRIYAFIRRQYKTTKSRELLATLNYLKNLRHKENPYKGLFCYGCGREGYIGGPAKCPDCGAHWPRFLEPRSPDDGGPVPRKIPRRILG